MLGSNVPLAGGLLKALERGESWECECIQVYTTPSRQWTVPELELGFAQEFIDAKAKTRIKRIIAHVPFLVNLASERTDLQEKSIARLTTEVFRAATLGIDALILHPGGFGRSNRANGMKRASQNLERVLSALKPGHPPILLENAAGQRHALGSRLEELGLLLGNFGNRCGACIDTAHLLAAGYDIRGARGWEKVLAEVDRCLGLSAVRAIHLNDSLGGLASGRDRHAAIGEGVIGMDTFFNILHDARFAECPMVLEIPDRDAKTAQSLKMLRDIQSLRSLPPHLKTGVRQTTLG